MGLNKNNTTSWNWWPSYYIQHAIISLFSRALHPLSTPMDTLRIHIYLEKVIMLGHEGKIREKKKYVWISTTRHAFLPLLLDVLWRAAVFIILVSDYNFIFSFLSYSFFFSFHCVMIVVLSWYLFVRVLLSSLQSSVLWFIFSILLYSFFSLSLCVSF